MKKIKNIHFTGIKGVGMTPLALIAKEAHFQVTGSDSNEEFITDEALQKAKITVYEGFKPEHVQNADLVITTGAHGGFDNAEVVFAKQKGITVWSHGQAVGEFMKGDILNRTFDGISVAGSHGKTTTTALLATLFSVSGFDPTYIIGTGSVNPLGNPGHLGKGSYFICEADEYATEIHHDKKPRFLWQSPKIAVITNIEHDHPDVYPSLTDVENAFLAFSNNIHSNGCLVYCYDNKQAKSVAEQAKVRTISYGFSPQSDYVLESVRVSDHQTFFWVKSKGVQIGNFALNGMGDHNALNALAAIVVGIESGLSLRAVQKGIASFFGSKRRMEYLGKMDDGALVFDDYAHHPTEIKATLSALKNAFPHKKIICIFQPHMYSRTKALFNEFAHSFADADAVYMVDIFPSAREAVDPTVSSKILSDSIAKQHRDVSYKGTLSETESYVCSAQFGRESVVVTMGAGNIYSIWKHILGSKNSRIS